jgi:hypothetical protein
MSAVVGRIIISMVGLENKQIGVGISFLSCVEAEIISSNLAYMKFSKELPVYVRRVGFPEMNWREICASFYTANIVRKSHEGISVNSSWLRKSITKFGPGVFPLLAH